MDQAVRVLLRMAPALPNAERASAETLCLPQHQSLTDEDLHRVVAELRRSLAARA
ncbi:DegT/DnrJ/EryC1/StrS family aminotransferase [Nocardia sp. NRRL S-836]|uniref:DegT/DnrJ/EryC1/StrS family aminotransferase n=1 Tax=Nocardia sp. NRRL S-836 TaxID=1519492 RepID=UPI0018D19BD9|nr:DegT/DnrJ/EryC1/StrS family aminotransferase [Nocardia sp. NRRL S-836]